MRSMSGGARGEGGQQEGLVPTSQPCSPTPGTSDRGLGGKHVCLVLQPRDGKVKQLAVALLDLEGPTYGRTDVGRAGVVYAVGS